MMFVRTVFILLLTVVPAFAQSGRTPKKPQGPPALTNSEFFDPSQSDRYSVGEVKGNIAPAKAILLPRPSFTEFAQDMGADGKVRVNIVIAADGTVSAAEPVSGDAALFETAKRAALDSRFLPLPTETPGYLIYEFQVRKANWFVVGFDLSSVVLMHPGIIRVTIPQEWTEEREVARQLCGLYRTRVKQRMLPVLRDFQERSDGNGTKNEVRATITLLPVDTEYARLAGELHSMVKQRLAPDASGLRLFEFGTAMQEVAKSMRDPSKMPYAYGLIEPFIGDSLLPQEILLRLKAMSDSQLKLTPASFMANLKEIAASARRVD